MFLKLLLSLAGSDKPQKSPPPKKKSKAELSREKDRREYALWEMAEEYDDDEDA